MYSDTNSPAAAGVYGSLPPLGKGIRAKLHHRSYTTVALHLLVSEPPTKHRFSLFPNREPSTNQEVLQMSVMKSTYSPKAINRATERVKARTDNPVVDRTGSAVPPGKRKQKRRARRKAMKHQRQG